MGSEPFELLKPIENDPQLDRPFHGPWREHQKPTSVRRRHDPTRKTASLVERPRLTDPKHWLRLHVHDLHLPATQIKKLASLVDPVRGVRVLCRNDGPRTRTRERLHVDVADAAVVGSERDESAIG